jgi:hypothetical protein
MPDSPTHIHLSPSGKWETPEFAANAWVSGDNRAKTWVYWWIDVERGDAATAAYELRRDGAAVLPRTPLVKSPKLYATTGFVEEKPFPGGRGPIGGAAKLDAGTYEVDFYLTSDAVEHVLRGVRFEVADRKARQGGWQIVPKEMQQD